MNSVKCLNNFSNGTYNYFINDKNNETINIAEFDLRKGELLISYTSAHEYELVVSKVSIDRSKISKPNVLDEIYLLLFQDSTILSQVISYNTVPINTMIFYIRFRNGDRIEVVIRKDENEWLAFKLEKGDNVYVSSNSKAYDEDHDERYDDDYRKTHECKVCDCVLIGCYDGYQQEHDCKKCDCLFKGCF